MSSRRGTKSGSGKSKSVQTLYVQTVGEPATKEAVSIRKPASSANAARVYAAKELPRQSGTVFVTKTPHGLVGDRVKVTKKANKPGLQVKTMSHLERQPTSHSHRSRSHSRSHSYSHSSRGSSHRSGRGRGRGHSGTFIPKRHSAVSRSGSHRTPKAQHEFRVWSGAGKRRSRVTAASAHGAAIHFARLHSVAPGTVVTAVNAEGYGGKYEYMYPTRNGLPVMRRVQ